MNMYHFPNYKRSGRGSGYQVYFFSSYKSLHPLGSLPRVALPPTPSRLAQFFDILTMKLLFPQALGAGMAQGLLPV